MRQMCQKTLYVYKYSDCSSVVSLMGIWRKSLRASGVIIAWVTSSHLTPLLMLDAMVQVKHCILDSFVHHQVIPGGGQLLRSLHSNGLPVCTPVALTHIYPLHIIVTLE